MFLSVLVSLHSLWILWGRLHYCFCSTAVLHQCLRMILFLWFSPCAQTGFLETVVCFGVGFMNQICCVDCMPSVNNHCSVCKWDKGGRFGQWIRVQKYVFNYSSIIFLFSSHQGVRYPGKPAGWQSGGGVGYIWKQVWQLPQIHGVQRPGLSQLQVAEARGVGSTWWSHRPLPTSTWSVIIS